MWGLGHWEKAFNSVGWFIPPYMQMGILGKIAAEITARGSSFDQNDLEQALSQLYEPFGLAAMVVSRRQGAAGAGTHHVLLA
jgi:hypothetical protein